MKKAIIILLAVMMALCLSACGSSEKKENADKPDIPDDGKQYQYLSEEDKHEGTWLTWPHDYGSVYDYYTKPGASTSYRDDIEDIWVAMTKALHTGEKVHIVAYDEKEQAHIKKLLKAENIDMGQIDFFICETDDVWIRDTGPIFVFDEDENLTIADFKFNGWGGKQEAAKDDALPEAIADAYDINIVPIPEMVLEGGAYEIDGAGTLLAAKSSIVSKNRNSEKSLEEVESYLSKYLGVKNFIWIEGSTDEDETDAHIDGTARFINDHQIFICDKEEYKELYLHDPDEADWEVFKNAKNAEGEKYELVHLPLTKATLKTYGKDMYYYGSYTNYYVANEVVLVPQYNDANDKKVLEIIGKHYPDKEVVGIDCINLIYYEGAIHCITQQQPAVK